MSQKNPHSYSANQHDEHSTWVWPPICTASDSSLQQSPNQKCLHEQMTIRNVRVLQSPLLPSSIYLQSHSYILFLFLVLFLQQSSIKFQSRSKANASSSSQTLNGSCCLNSSCAFRLCHCCIIRKDFRHLDDCSPLHLVCVSSSMFSEI